MKKGSVFIFLLLLMVFLASCAHSPSAKPTAEPTAESRAPISPYAEMEFDTKLYSEPKRPNIAASQYIRAWRGSYKDSNGNYIEDGWENIRVREESPNANF